MLFSMLCITIITIMLPSILTDPITSFPSMFKILLNNFSLSILPVSAKLNMSFTFISSYIELVYFSTSFRNDEIFSESCCDFKSSSCVSA